MSPSKGKKQEKICTEYSPSMSKEEEAKIKQAILTGDNTKASALRAAFLKSNVWDNEITIKVNFMDMEKAKGIDIYDRNRYDQEQITGPYDELQEAFWDLQEAGKLDIPTAIKQIVEERIAPLVNLTFDFDTTTNYTKNDLTTERANTILISFEPDGAWSMVGKSVNNVGAKQDWTDIQGWPEQIADYKLDTFTFNANDGDDAVKNYCKQVLASVDPDGTSMPQSLADNVTATKGLTYYGATMNFGWFDVPTTIHEFGHALGMIHEHQNPYGTEIQWNTDKLYNEYQGSPNFWSPEQTFQQIVEKYSQNEINGSTFDPCSVMLYFFSSDLTTNGVGSKQNMRMSPTDMYWLAKQYPADPGAPDSDEKSLALAKEQYNKIYNKTDDDLDFDTKLADCNALAATFGESQPNTTSSSDMLSGMLSGGNTRNIIIGLLVVLIVALLLK